MQGIVIASRKRGAGESTPTVHPVTEATVLGTHARSRRRVCHSVRGAATVGSALIAVIRPG